MYAAKAAATGSVSSGMMSPGHGEWGGGGGGSSGGSTPVPPGGNFSY